MLARHQLPISMQSTSYRADGRGFSVAFIYRPFLAVLPNMFAGRYQRVRFLRRWQDENRRSCVQRFWDLWRRPRSASLNKRLQKLVKRSGEQTKLQIRPTGSRRRPTSLSVAVAVHPRSRAENLPTGEND